MAAGIAGILLTAAINALTVAFEREQARDAFARFVPEAVVDQVLANADGVRLGGVRSEATVMFSDLRGFTSFSETLEPERVIESLNRYLTEMSEAILNHGGTLVAYMGDGIMAVFGAPLKQDDHADRALEAAREMLDRMEGFNAWLREQDLIDGFKMGIGLNSGPVMSGNVGSERRLEYTALGRHDEHRRAPRGHDQGHAAPVVHLRHDQADAHASGGRPGGGRGGRGAWPEGQGLAVVAQGRPRNARRHGRRRPRPRSEFRGVQASRRTSR